MRGSLLGAGTRDLRALTAPQSAPALLRSPGESLSRSVRTFAEPRFGFDFSQVRIHADEEAAMSADAVRARAFTVGHRVVFGANEYAPSTSDGRRLLMHELAHVVQQSEGAPLVIARVPKPATSASAGQEDAVRLRETMLRVYEIMSPAARQSLERNSTIVLGIIAQGKDRLIGYAVAGNGMNPEIRAAAERLGLFRLDPRGVEKIAGQRHAEQLFIEGAESNSFRVRLMAVSRKPCRDCGPFVASEKIPIEWVRDPNPPPRPSIAGASSGRGAKSSTPRSKSAPSMRKPVASASAAQPAAHPSLKTTGRQVRAEVGPKVSAVSDSTPGYRTSNGAAIGGAIQILQSMQFASLQRAEVAKFEARYAALQPKIDAFFAKGYAVELTLVVEKPDRPDLLCAARVYCDQSQFIYFRELFISYVERAAQSSPRASEPKPYATMGPSGDGTGHVPYVHEGGSLTEAREIRAWPARHDNYHLESAKETLRPALPLALTDAPADRKPTPRAKRAEPKLDDAVRRALAAAPSNVYVLTSNILQYKTAAKVIKSLAGNPMFGMVKESMSGGYLRARTIVDYRNDLDAAKAEALAKIVRAMGVSSAVAERVGNGDDDPGLLQVWFGLDAER